MLSLVQFFATPWTPEPQSPTLQADSLPAEPQGKPKNTGVGSLSLLQQIFLTQESNWGFSDSSVGKESTCNAGDPGLIPGLERSAGEGIRYPLQYSWASLVVQLVKNTPAMQETWV